MVQKSLNGQLSSINLSEIELAILKSTTPIEITETDEITVLGQRGIWANKLEEINWKGVLPISEYKINEDNEPEIITKKIKQHLEYVQEIAIKYLRPPAPPSPGEIIIKQEQNIFTPPAPPLIIRQQQARPVTPEPLVIREAPPDLPPVVGRKLITISGKSLPPPPRKVVIERLPSIPNKPQSVLIERWLPYKQVKRKVIFQQNKIPDPVVIKPRNIIVQWEAPEVRIRKEFKNLGLLKANPFEYIQKYGSKLLKHQDLPDFVNEFKTPDGIQLAAHSNNSTVHELEGDIEALKLIDLDKENLSEYKNISIKSKSTNSISISDHANNLFKSTSMSQTNIFAKNEPVSVKIGESKSSLSATSEFSSIIFENKTNIIVDGKFSSNSRSNTQLKDENRNNNKNNNKTLSTNSLNSKTISNIHSKKSESNEESVLLTENKSSNKSNNGLLDLNFINEYLISIDLVNKSLDESYSVNVNDRILSVSQTLSDNKPENGLFSLSTKQVDNSSYVAKVNADTKIAEFKQATKNEPADVNSITNQAKSLSYYGNLINYTWSGNEDPLYGGSEQYLKKVFKFMDIDKTGFIKLDEVKTILNHLNTKLSRTYTDKHAIRFFNAFDLNKDNLIDFEEFRDAMRFILKL